MDYLISKLWSRVRTSSKQCSRTEGKVLLGFVFSLLLLLLLQPPCHVVTRHRHLDFFSLSVTTVNGFPHWTTLIGWAKSVSSSKLPLKFRLPWSATSHLSWSVMKTVSIERPRFVGVKTICIKFLSDVSDGDKSPLQLPLALAYIRDVSSRKLKVELKKAATIVYWGFIRQKPNSGRSFQYKSHSLTQGYNNNK